jgi:PBP1b-binding outer membrane lipoprotein LpoB
MKKTAIFIMAAMIIFSIAGCSATVSNSKTSQQQQKAEDLNLGQSLYDGEPHLSTSVSYGEADSVETAAYANRFTNYNYDGFAIYTPFGPLNPDEAPPALNIPINWYQDYNIVTDFPTL